MSIAKRRLQAASRTQAGQMVLQSLNQQDSTGCQIARTWSAQGPSHLEPQSGKCLEVYRHRRWGVLKIFGFDFSGMSFPIALALSTSRLDGLASVTTQHSLKCTVSICLPLCSVQMALEWLPTTQLAAPGSCVDIKTCV